MILVIVYVVCYPKIKQTNDKLHRKNTFFVNACFLSVFFGGNLACLKNSAHCIIFMMTFLITPQDPPNKPKKSLLLSRIFSKPPPPKPLESSKTPEEPSEPEPAPAQVAPPAKEAEEQESRSSSRGEQESRSSSRGEQEKQEVDSGKSLPKRPHRLLPQRTLAVLDQTVDPSRLDLGFDF